MPWMTYRLSPTGGVSSAISILMVTMTANQTPSNPSDVIRGYTMGRVMSMHETTSKNMPSTK